MVHLEQELVALADMGAVALEQEGTVADPVLEGMVVDLALEDTVLDLELEDTVLDLEPEATVALVLQLDMELEITTVAVPEVADQEMALDVIRTRLWTPDRVIRMDRMEILVQATMEE